VDACAITSPIDGFVDRVGVVPGEVVDVSAELTRVLKLDPIHVRMDFPEERIEEVSLGQTVDVTLDAFPAETLSGAVVRISPEVHPDLRVMPVMIEIPNPENRIKPGMNGFARLRLKKEATIVPAAAVIRRGSRAMVFRVEDGRARIREIQPGPLAGGGRLEVHAGLTPGQEIVIYGQQDLAENDPVDVDWRNWARRE
jgi:Cu(I)/Ag(I) efflux system membrane fusion protein